MAGKAAPTDPAARTVVLVELAGATEISVECGVTRSGTAGGAGLSPSCPLLLNYLHSCLRHLQKK